MRDTNIVKVFKVANGSARMTIPRQIVQDLGIDTGDYVFVESDIIKQEAVFKKINSETTILNTTRYYLSNMNNERKDAHE